MLINASPVTEASKEQTNPRYFSSDIVYNVRAAAVRLLQAPLSLQDTHHSFEQDRKTKSLIFSSSIEFKKDTLGKIVSFEVLYTTAKVWGPN